MTATDQVAQKKTASEGSLGSVLTLKMLAYGKSTYSQTLSLLLLPLQRKITEIVL